MTEVKETTTAKVNAKELVLKCVNAINNLDFSTARKCLHDNFTFEGVLGTRNGGDVYIEDMKKMQLKYNVKKTFADENDVCLLYDLTMSGLVIYGCGWYKVENDKIISLKVVFDPRPVLEASKKQ